jgi:isoamylase
MLLFGDECRRTQAGNNNAYCQDNVISWFNWTLVEKNQDLWRFCQALIAFRRSEPSVRRSNFLLGEPRLQSGFPDVAWFSAAGGTVDWTQEQRSLVCMLAAAPRTDLLAPENHHLLMMYNSGVEPRTFVIPADLRAIPWQKFIDTAAESPNDIHPSLDGPPPPANGRLKLEGRSMIALIAPDETLAP